MTGHRKAIRLLAVAATLLALLPQMQGCAGGRSSANGDLPTQSDDSEVRKRARIRMELATTYYAQGQYTVALDELKQAEAIDPSLPATSELRGLIYDAMGEKKLADTAFKRALRLNDRDGSVMHNYAWFLCRDGQYAAADAMFDKAIAQPQTVSVTKAMLAKGVCQLNAGLLPEAEKTLARSYELDPSNPATAFNLALVQYRRGELDRARFYIKRVNSNPSQVTAASLWLAIRIERRMGDMSAVDQLAEQLRGKFAGTPEANAFEMGRFDE